MAAIVTAAPAVAQQTDTREPIAGENSDLHAELMGWGPRVGVAVDPDQVVAGLHWDIGRFARHLRLVPNFEIGVGDDHTIASVTVPLHYVFRDVDVNFYPYVGGGVTLGWVDRDLPPPAHGDDSDLEAAVKGIGGMEWRLTRSTDFFLEANVLIGDLQDVEVLAGWTFRR